MDGVAMMVAEDLTLSPLPFTAPPSRGAQLLADWLGKHDGHWNRLLVSIDAGPSWIDRVLGGEIVPTDEIASDVAELSKGAVPVDSWNRPAAGGWHG